MSPLKNILNAIFTLLLVALLIGGASRSMAQNTSSPMAPVSVAPPQPTAPANTPASDALLTVSGVKVSPGEVNPNTMMPLVFTFWEHAAIIDARNSRGTVRPPSQAELAGALNNNGAIPDVKAAPTGPREITLEGILYYSPVNWTIWLNHQRINILAIPKEILSIKVYKQYVELKWFDDYSNQIYAVRLHPHERFNLDSRVFLPE